MSDLIAGLGDRSVGIVFIESMVGKPTRAKTYSVF
jgi:hypothetical protein